MSTPAKPRHAVLQTALLIAFGGLAAAPAARAGDTPIAASDYAAMLDRGFAVNWFKGTLASDYTDTSLTRTMQDLSAANYDNLRLRSRGDLFGFADVGGNAATTMDTTSMNAYLAELDRVTTRAVANRMISVISWTHDNAEARASVQDGNNFVAWWSTVANHLKSADQSIAFNLFTELGNNAYSGTGSKAANLYNNLAVYQDWTNRAIAAIRATGGNNATRNIIVTAPQSGKADSLQTITPTLWTDPANAGHLLFELHDYAAGPKYTGARTWHGDGSAAERANITDMMDAMVAFKNQTGAPGYYGAWMPEDNSTGALTQTEVENFARFFAAEAAKRGLPTSLNDLGNYYDAKKNQWLISGSFAGTPYDVSLALAAANDGYYAGLAAIPEPAEYGVMGAGAIAAIAMIRRRARRAA